MEENNIVNETSEVNENNIKTKIVRSAKWTTGKSIVDMVYGPLHRVLLAMVISPIGFAYIAAISVALHIGDLLSKIGFSQALIVEKDSGSRQFSTVFWIDTVTAFVFSIAVMCCAGFVERFYQLEDLTEMIEVGCLCILFTGMTRTFRCYLQKELKLDVTVKIEIIQHFTDSALTLGLTIACGGMMGYVYGMVLSRLLTLLMFAFAAFKNGYKMGFHFDVAFLKKIRTFAFSVTFRQLFDYLVGKTDEFIITAAFPDKTVLGIYFFAKSLLGKPCSVIVASVSQVALSALSKFADNVKKVASLYLKLSKYLALVTFPVMAGIAVTASEFLPAFFGEEYAGAAIYMQCLAISSMFGTITFSPGSAVLYTMKKPKTMLYLDLINNGVYLLFMVLLARYGVMYVVAAKLASTCCTVPLMHIVTRRTLGVSESQYVKETIAVPFIATAAMTLAVIAIKIFIPESLGVWVELGASVVGGAAVYAVVMYVKELNTFKEMLAMLKRR